MSRYDKVKNYYGSGLWDINRVSNAVIKEWITAAEFEEITGEPYEERQLNKDGEGV